MPVTEDFAHEEPAEAAHVPSRLRTEPMRIGRRRPRLGPLSMRPRIAAVDASLCGDRARRFAWPARGTERFLGRDADQKFPPEGEIGKQCRRCLGTDNGLTPDS